MPVAREDDPGAAPYNTANYLAAELLSTEFVPRMERLSEKLEKLSEATKVPLLELFHLIKTERDAGKGTAEDALNRVRLKLR